MHHIDILDKEITIDGHLLRFPLSYEEIKAVLGEARIEEHRGGKSYVYDKEGMVFEEGSIEGFKKAKAYIDAEHLIKDLHLYVTDKQWILTEILPTQFFVGNVTFFGNKKEHDFLNRYMGFYQDYVCNEDGGHFAWTGAYVEGEDKDPNYDGDRFAKNLTIVYKPVRPKSNENYAIVTPEEPCLVFENLNFKLAVINELMYEQEVLKPYFDIYDYMAFKKAHWNLETMKNVRGAVQFFKDLPIPVSMAERVEKINMDGGNEIYMNIAPMWDGEDERFHVDKISEAELKQFPNLKSMRLLTTKLAALQKQCDPLGIAVIEV